MSGHDQLAAKAITATASQAARLGQINVRPVARIYRESASVMTERTVRDTQMTERGQEKKEGPSRFKLFLLL